MDSAPKEIELKLWVTPEDIAVLRNHAQFSGALRDCASEMVNSVYFDSDDKSLRKRGLTLRVRRIGDKRIQTIKSAGNGSDWFERSELEQAIEGDQPDFSNVLNTVLGPAFTQDVRASLRPVFETRVERTVYQLNGSDTEIVVAVDEGQIISADASCPISEIELELKHGNPAELFKIARTISEIVPAQLDVKSKSERGYDLIEKTLVTAEKAHDLVLSAGMNTARAFTLIGRACLRHLVANEPATRMRNAEALHQMRVALRRLRAAISLFSDVVSDDQIDTIKTELRWLGHEFGPARNLDVLIIEVIKPMRKQYANEPGLDSLGKMFARERLKGYRRAQEAVASARFRALILDTAEWIEAGSWSTSNDPLMRARREMPIEAYAAQQLSRRRKKIRRGGVELDRLSPEQLHKLRIQVKKMRYASEFFSSVYPGKKVAKRCKEILSSLARLQNCLGGINDVVTRKALFSGIIAAPGRRLTTEQNRHRAYAAGLIMGDQQAQLPRLLDRARQAYARFDGAKTFWKQRQSRNSSAPQNPSPSAN